MRLSAIAKALGATLRSDDDPEIRAVNTLDAAGPGEISFLANPKYAPKLAGTQADAVIVSAQHADAVRRAVISENPYMDFGRTLGLFAVRQGSMSGVSGQAFVHPDAVLGKDVTVYPFAFIGPRTQIGDRVTVYPGVYIGEDCTVGNDTTIYPNAVLMARTAVGNDCIINPGAVLGADGFGFTRTPVGIMKIPQTGSVAIGNDVEIGANTTVDRAVLAKTTIGDGTKVDNLVQVAHNVVVGKETFLVSQVGIAGSTQVGDHCTLAGQVGVSGHLTIGNDVTIGPQSGVVQNIESGQVVGGSPTVPQNIFMRTLALMPRFPELFKRISRLEKELAALKDRNEA